MPRNLMLYRSIWDYAARAPEGDGAGATPPPDGSGAPPPDGGSDAGKAKPDASAAAAAGAGEGGSGDAGPKADPPPAKPKDWRDERLADKTRQTSELTSQLETEKAKTALLEETLAEIKKGTKGADGALSEAQIQEKAERIASQRVANAEWIRTTDEIWAAGVALYGDKFNAMVTDLTKVTEKIPQTLLLAAHETGEAGRLIGHLAGDLDEYARITKLAPLRQAVELTKLAAKLAAQPKSSKAPPPVDILGNGGARPAELGDKMSDAEWLTARNKQLGIKSGAVH